MHHHASLDLHPGERLGPFQLGATLFNLVNLLQNYRSTYPSIKLAWDEHAPSTSPIHLRLTTPPLSLLFSASSQRLVRIQVDGPSPGEWVNYHGKSLREASDDEAEDVVKLVNRVLGPTYSPSTDGGEGEQILSYPGVAFGVVRAASGGSKLSRIIMTPLPAPTQIPVETAWLHPTLPDSPAIAQGDLRLAEIILDASRKPSAVNLHFHFPNAPNPPPSISLVLGQTTSEDLLCELGSPIRSFWKEDDRMSIHTTSSSTTSDPSLLPNPYFTSYPHLGLTFLLDPTSHVLLKIILHSNLPGEVNFGRSARCFWEMVVVFPWPPSS
ncbi:hypothetical protein MNV49_001087 [Pseudohyphozyma bogoriensis]|nr:hypothetical protein MNV49_001087 [Pseudohyphozyma bogoriensis]